ncbi:hypothetical protein FSST1_003940 [Fusarium sambucinum]
MAKNRGSKKTTKGPKTKSHRGSTSNVSKNDKNDNFNPQNESNVPVIPPTQETFDRPIIQETLDRLDALVAANKTAGPNDQKTKLAFKAAKESLESWRKEILLDKCLEVTMELAPKAGPSAKQAAWFKKVQDLVSEEMKNPGRNREERDEFFEKFKNLDR